MKKNQITSGGGFFGLTTVCSSAAAAVAIGQLQLQLSHYSLVALQAFCFLKCDF